MRRLGEEVRGTVLVQLEMRTGGLKRAGAEGTVWVAATFALKIN
jgi:hypothetical protein